MAQRHPAKVDAGYGTVSNKRITPINYLVRHFVRSRLLKRNEDWHFVRDVSLHSGAMELF